MKISAYAKINLCLDVIGRRADGYHDLNMIMLPLQLCDEIEIELAQQDEFSANIDLPFDANNLVNKAVDLMRKTYALTDCFKIHVTKNIPMQAGLAGGSADAAAVMKAINELCKLNISLDELAKLGKKIGADVPFCIISKPAVVNGIGEKINCFDYECDFDVLLIKPQLGVSTKQAFEMLDFTKCEHPDVEKVKNCLLHNDFEALKTCCFNSLEESAFRLNFEIAKIKENLVDDGFDVVLMSGSGSTVFALTRDKNKIEKAYHAQKYLTYFKEKTKIRK